METQGGGAAEGTPSAQTGWTLRTFLFGQPAFAGSCGGALLGVVSLAGWLMMFVETHVKYSTDRSFAAVDYHTKQAAIFVGFIDRLSCASDPETTRKQQLIYDLTLEAAIDFIGDFNKYKLSCPTTEAERTQQLNIFDKNNNSEIFQLFQRYLSGARSQYADGMRDVQTMSLFEKAYNALPKDYQANFDRDAYETAHEAFERKNYDRAFTYYMEAFRKIQ